MGYWPNNCSCRRIGNVLMMLVINVEFVETYSRNLIVRPLTNFQIRYRVPNVRDRILGHKPTLAFLPPPSLETPFLPTRDGSLSYIP